jgi:hypothetical protein
MLSTRGRDEIRSLLAKFLTQFWHVRLLGSIESLTAPAVYGKNCLRCLGAKSPQLTGKHVSQRWERFVTQNRSFRKLFKSMRPHSLPA